MKRDVNQLFIWQFLQFTAVYNIHCSFSFHYVSLHVTGIKDRRILEETISSDSVNNHTLFKTSMFLAKVKASRKWLRKQQYATCSLKNKRYTQNTLIVARYFSCFECPICDTQWVVTYRAMRQASCPHEISVSQCVFAGLGQWNQPNYSIEKNPLAGNMAIVSFQSTYDL